MKFERCIDVGTHQGLLLAASGRPAACGTAGALHHQCIARHMHLAPEKLDMAAAQLAESCKREYHGELSTLVPPAPEVSAQDRISQLRRLDHCVLERSLGICKYR
jgi:hypothetical protein